MISIIVPVFNKEKYIKNCILSIIEQTYANFECLVIDDGSTDNSATIIMDLMKSDKRIKYFYQENSGVSSARNKGISLAKKEWICFIDADDFILPNYLDTLVHLTENKNCVAVFSGGPMNANISIKDICNQMDKIYNYKIFNPPWGKLYKKELIANMFNEMYSIGEDLIFNLTFFEDNLDKNICFTKYHGYSYSENITSSLSSTISIEKIQQGIQLIYELNKFQNIQTKKIIKVQSNSLFNKIINYCVYKTNNIENLNKILDMDIYKFVSLKLKLILLLKSNRLNLLYIFSKIVICVKGMNKK